MSRQSQEQFKVIWSLLLEFFQGGGGSIVTNFFYYYSNFFSVQGENLKAKGGEGTASARGPTPVEISQVIKKPAGLKGIRLGNVRRFSLPAPH